MTALLLLVVAGIGLLVTAYGWRLAALIGAVTAAVGLPMSVLLATVLGVGS